MGLGVQCGWDRLGDPGVQRGRSTGDNKVTISLAGDRAVARAWSRKGRVGGERGRHRDNMANLLFLHKSVSTLLGTRTAS